MSQKIKGTLTTRGGQRKNAGRKNTGDAVETVVMRVPKVLAEKVKSLIRSYRKSNEYQVRVEKFKVKVGQNMVIIFSYWNSKKEYYECLYLLKKVTIVKKSYFETDGKWRFGRIGLSGGKIFERTCNEYRSLVKTNGKPDLTSAEPYNKNHHKNIDFL